MVYCGSGTETIIFISQKNLVRILWSTAEAVLRRKFFHNLLIIYLILWSTAEAVLRHRNFNS